MPVGLSRSSPFPLSRLAFLAAKRVSEPAARAVLDRVRARPGLARSVVRPLGRAHHYLNTVARLRRVSWKVLISYYYANIFFFRYSL